MKHLKFTYVDAVTGISIAAQPAVNGPKFPTVEGLEFVWARESAYPTETPEFFGTCPDESSTQVDGVLGEFTESDWLKMQAQEMRARLNIPMSVTMRQARLALLAAGFLEGVTKALSELPEPNKSAALIEWEYALEVRRDSPLIVAASSALGLTDEQVDALFVAAGSL